MTMKMGWLGLAAAVAGGIFACSGSTASTGGGNAACLQQSTSSACYSCMTSQCGSQVSTFESSCTDYISCICPGGSYDACNVASCSSHLTATGACQGADMAVGQCAEASCASECDTTSGSSSGGTCTGSSSGGGSGSSSGSSAMQCLQSSTTNTACYSCVAATCSAQLSALENGCSAYISCVCPGGVYDANNVTACQSQEMVTSCTSALQPFATCEEQSCAAACTTTVTDGG